MANKKRRGDGEGTVYQRKDGRWVAKVTVGFKPDDSPKRRTFYGKERPEVVKKMNEVLVELEKGTYIEPTTDTLEKWLTDWLEGRKPYIAENTWNTYETMLRIHINPALGKVKLKNLRTRDIQKLLNDKFESGLSPRSFKYIYQT